MSLDMSTVQMITIPEGSVAQITDSNNNVLWKIPYRYRKLQYIEAPIPTAPGQYCIQLPNEDGTTADEDNYYQITYQLTTTSWGQGTGQYYGALVATNDGNDKKGCYMESSGRVTWGFDTISQRGVTGKLLNTNKHTAYVQPYDAAGYNYTRLMIDGVSTGAIELTFNNARNRGEYSLFNEKYDNSGWSIAAKVYEFISKSGTGTYDVKTTFVPVQDKLTGLCGMYNTRTNTFHTNVNPNYNFIPGPTVTENYK